MTEWDKVTKWMHAKTEVPDSLTIRKIAEIMVKRGIGSVIVVSSDEESAMLTERDIMSKVVAKGLDPGETFARDVATKPLVTIREDATVWEAAELMSKRHIRRLPVVNTEGAIIGLITTRSVSDALPVISRFPETGALMDSLRRMTHHV
ncbi:MAG: CBS domain-containing protein [Thaumarchaeota archaeon]|nr:CBS domain-containing protein [Nitrososphaerota archaeon]MCL5318062.1 CBS domain-containing protein [Nitrososphaerota archaeon]